jgi:hypothetical protein
MADEQKNNATEVYQIKIQGHLDTQWSEWFYDLAITQDEDGTTTLFGPLPDQTVLHSVLDRIRDLNLSLLSVSQIVSGGKKLNYEVKGPRHVE